MLEDYFEEEEEEEQQQQQQASAEVAITVASNINPTALPSVFYLRPKKGHSV